MTRVKDIQGEVASLHEQGRALVRALESGKESPSFAMGYQKWYTRALPVVKTLAPDRYGEFKAHYEVPPRRTLLGFNSFVIQDYIKGVDPGTYFYETTDLEQETARLLESQLAILGSLQERARWARRDVEDRVLVEVLGAELDTARALITKSPRAAAAVAGAVLCTYLQRLRRRHRIKMAGSPRKPPPGAVNDALHRAGVYATDIWRQVRWLVALHERRTLPSDVAADKVRARDLIDGADWLIKNVF